MHFLYPSLVFVHLGPLFVLLLLHGGVVAVTHTVRSERDLTRIRAFLDLGRVTLDSRGGLGRVLSVVLQHVSPAPH